MQAVSALGLVKCTIRAVPLPQDIWNFLRDNLALLRRMQQERKSRQEVDDGIIEESQSLDDVEDGGVDLQGEVIKKPTIKLEDFWTAFRDICVKAGGDWVDLVEKLWAFGPQRAGTCVLVDSRTEVQPNS